MHDAQCFIEHQVRFQREPDERLASSTKVQQVFYMSTVIRVNDSTRRFWTTLPTHPVSLRLNWHIINKPADCQPRKKNSWQLNVCVDGEIGNNCWGEEGGERPGIDVLDANAFECVIKSSDMVVICKADQLPTTRTLDEKKERKKGKKGKEISFLILDKSLAVSV